MPSLSSQDIQLLTETAYKFGPFFFSIVFTIYLTCWAYKKYNRALERVPPLSPRDLDINRTMFLTTFFFGIALVVVSILWWLLLKPSQHIFRGKIQNLQPQEEIAADDYYLKSVPRPVMVDDEDKDGLLRNEEFIILSPTPFHKGQQFELDYSKNHKRREKLWITYEAGDEEPVFEVAYDESNQRAFLKRVAAERQQDVSTSLSWLREKTVLAAALVMRQNKTTNGASSSARDALMQLQDPRATVATKLDAIDFLNSMPVESLRQDLDLEMPEPPALTIFDLTQHSDQELAYKAKLLSNRINIDSYLVGNLSSSDAARRNTAEQILLRISQKHAQSILHRVDTTKYRDLREVSDDVTSGQKTQVLKPTASDQGDRYYIKVTWNPSDARTTSCLARVFNKAPTTTKTLSQEEAPIKESGQRFVYRYSKDSAINVAKEVKECGGSAQFVLAY